ncbi:hypothetical protein [Paenibacillus alvei]|uniref:hypothetical protein n=1 Tax=Paenibacillus alvei TaxID=44250 RepID=UPI0022804C47|nr:hypothetical protein [Paenibacillus alvei]MCY7486398.1 hypothetical protein [Paenibacillus alvei]
MNWIKLSINNGEMNGVLELDKLSNENKAALIDGFFKAFGVDEVKSNVSKADATVNVSPAKFETSDRERIIPMKDIVTHMNEASAKLVASLSPIAQRMKEVMKPPLINSERNLSVQVGEKLAAAAETAKEKPEWWTTGIKYKDGVARHRCRYYCQNPGCQDKRNVYIRLDESEVKCHSCGQKLAVRLATGEYEDFDKMIPERDKFGNFFIADHPAME